MDLILLQLKISKKAYAQAQKIATEILRKHEVERDALHEEVKLRAKPETLDRWQAKLDAMSERERRITVQNVIRDAIDAGLATKRSHDTIMDGIARNGVPRGRPTGSVK